MILRKSSRWLFGKFVPRLEKMAPKLAMVGKKMTFFPVAMETVAGIRDSGKSTVTANHTIKPTKFGCDRPTVLGWEACRTNIHTYIQTESKFWLNDNKGLLAAPRGDPIHVHMCGFVT